MSIPAPIIEPRDAATIWSDLYGRLPGYTPGFEPTEGTAGKALMRIFARYMELYGLGLNQVPDLHFLAFLDSLGVSLLPAQSARIPLVFTLQDDSPADTTLPANSQVAAISPPESASPLLAENEAPKEPAPIMLSTGRTVTLTRARLAALYSLDPTSDHFADHSDVYSEGFNLFGGLMPVEHGIYLGHDELFDLAEEAEVALSFTLGPASPQSRKSLDINWEYLSEDGWLPLIVVKEGDDTNGLTVDGELRLSKSCGPNAREESIGDRTSYWIRGLMATPFSSQDTREDALAVDQIRASVGFTRSNLPIEAAFTDVSKLDTANTFFPFGKYPQNYTTFYLASEEVFKRKGAQISFVVDTARVGKADDTEKRKLIWEYNNGATWKTLSVEDQTDGFTTRNPEILEISFTAPVDWNAAEVNGVENYWMRVRVQGMDYPYGHATQYSVENQVVTETPATLKPPSIASLTLSYTYETSKTALDHCLAFNDFAFEDHSHSCRWLRKTFQPFLPLVETAPSVHFGFDRRLPQGLISMYLHVEEPDGHATPTTDTSAYTWEYFGEPGWTELGVLDETKGFIQSGMIQFVGPKDAIAIEGLGGELFHIRARLKRDERIDESSIRGAWLNAAWAMHHESVEGEIVGESDGNPDQTYFLQKNPVLDGEIVEVRVWAGTGADWETAARDIPETDLRLEHEPGTERVTAVWARWHARNDFYTSTSLDRHYVVERASGWLRFGDGKRGMIPPAGARVAISYETGGGLAGNLPANADLQLYAAVPFVTAVTNPVSAGGGADAELFDGVRLRGPQRLRHRDRAVTPSDFEWLAREASPAVARARCLPTSGDVGRGQRGWVTLIVVPHSYDLKPQLEPGLRLRIQDYLTERVPAAVAGQVRITDPAYMPIGVSAEITPVLPGEAAVVEAQVLKELDSFLQSLNGGPEGKGWDFGQTLYLSQIAHLIEQTPGVAYAQQIRLIVEGQVFDEIVPVNEDMLIAPGDHEIRIVLEEM